MVAKMEILIPKLNMIWIWLCLQWGIVESVANAKQSARSAQAWVFKVNNSILVGLLTFVVVLGAYFLFAGNNRRNNNVNVNNANNRVVPPNRGVAAVQKTSIGKSVVNLTETSLHTLASLALPEQDCVVSISINESMLEDVSTLALVLERLSEVATVVAVVSHSISTGDELILQHVAAHRLLRFSSCVGKVAIVRQLQPQLHIEFDPVVVDLVCPHVRTVSVGELVPSTAGSKKEPWRCIRHLGELFRLGT